LRTHTNRPNLAVKKMLAFPRFLTETVAMGFCRVLERTCFDNRGHGTRTEEGGSAMRKHWFVVVLAVFLLSGFSVALMGCDIGSSDDCHAQCDTDDDCGEGYLCYDDGLCDNEDKNCVEDD